MAVRYNISNVSIIKFFFIRGRPAFIATIYWVVSFWIITSLKCTQFCLGNWEVFDTILHFLCGNIGHKVTQVPCRLACEHEIKRAKHVCNTSLRAMVSHRAYPVVCPDPSPPTYTTPYLWGILSSFSHILGKFVTFSCLKTSFYVVFPPRHSLWDFRLGYGTIWTRPTRAAVSLAASCSNSYSVIVA